MDSWLVLTIKNKLMLKNPFSKKSTITLTKALELKDQLQEKLKSNHKILKLENSVLQGQERNYDLKKIVKENDKLQNKVIDLKLIVQAANLNVIPKETKCISYYVYLLSEKKNQILNLQSMAKKAVQGTNIDEDGVARQFAKPVYTRPDIEDWVDILRKECSVIENKLTKLNNLIIVELPFKI